MPGATIFYVFFVILGKYTAGGQDGTLSCPTTWYEGVRVELICTVNKNRGSACLSTNETRFQVQSKPLCTVTPRLYDSCLDAANTTRPVVESCWCLQNSTDYIFKYIFNAERYAHSGNWTCFKNCYNTSTGSSYAMQITDCPNVKVEDNACSNNSCHKEGTDVCTVSTKFPNTSYCICKPGYSPPLCEKTELVDKCPVASVNMSSALMGGLVGLAVGALVAALVSAVLFKKKAHVEAQRNNDAMQSALVGHSTRKPQMAQQEIGHDTGKFLEDPSSVMSSSASSPSFVD